MANIFSKHRNKMREQSKKKKDKTVTSAESSQCSKQTSAVDEEVASSGGLIKCQILSLSHEGRGIAKNKGKTQFVHYALPGEMVLAEVLAHRSKYDELKAIKVIESAEKRVEAKCQYFGACGGCSLQHFSHDAQLEHKQSVLLDQLSRFADISPDECLPPVASKEWSYRTRAKLSVDYGRKGEGLRIGYRKKNSKEILDIDACPILEAELSEIIPKLKPLFSSLSGNKPIGHLELSSSNEGKTLLLRHVKALGSDDLKKIKDFAQKEACIIYLQPGDISSIHKIWPEDNQALLSYNLDLETEAHKLSFHPKDFTQINQGVNQKMVNLAVQMLDLKPDEKALDLFSGLGNFALAMAKEAASIVGIEGSLEMVDRAQENARQNQIENASFYESNLYGDFFTQAWAKESYDKVLIDPPRAGALEIVSNIDMFQAKRIVYISCNPATLARDAGILVQHGYRLSKAGILDMFPHTEHLESIAIFDRK